MARSDHVPVWAFDVDGTLIGSVRSDRLRPGVVQLLAGLADRGASLVLWSAGGAPYARQMAEAHGIADWFTAFYGKDGRGVDGRYLTDHFDPEHQPLVYVDDVGIDMPMGATVVEVSQFLGGNDADAVMTSVLARLDEWFGA